MSEVKLPKPLEEYTVSNLIPEGDYFLHANYVEPTVVNQKTALKITFVVDGIPSYENELKAEFIGHNFTLLYMIQDSTMFIMRMLFDALCLPTSELKKRTLNTDLLLNKPFMAKIIQQTKNGYTNNRIAIGTYAKSTHDVSGEIVPSKPIKDTTAQPKKEDDLPF